MRLIHICFFFFFFFYKWIPFLLVRMNKIGQKKQKGFDGVSGSFHSPYFAARLNQLDCILDYLCILLKIPFKLNIQSTHILCLYAYNRTLIDVHIRYCLLVGILFGHSTTGQNVLFSVSSRIFVTRLILLLKCLVTNYFEFKNE